ncbi:ATP-dependent RNA helicase DHX30-like [Bombus huntii]|uniref:ATP-dependent RNA helicase DHX30-like n=1 Tax=Bombus huntii TaxID=85661 RepID=UPI0021AAE1BC|nr:ATP-dependent RNA helicase DHX30-like [Bombus huntii]XP_050474060.1 ATP-dependent RNA helicase DHX30-like [Bombus huntii]XP_050474061.1 ATP-dependent RNA helicase DHX30-like [Bombus huntii]
MILSEIMLNSRKSLCSHLIFYCTNKMYRSHLRKFYNYQTFYRCYKKESKIKPQSDTSYNFNIDKNNLREVNNSMQKQKEQDTNVPNFNDFAIRKTSLEKIHPYPKQNLDLIYSAVYREFNKLCISYTYSVIKGKINKMKCTIDVTWPYEASFCNIASNKKKAAHDAALMCLDWLYMNGKIKDFKPILYDNKSKHSFCESQRSVNINLSPEFTSKIQSLIDTFNNEVKSIITIPCATELNEDSSEKESEDNLSLDDDFAEMHSNHSIRNVKTRYKDITDLPIINYKEEILNALENNQVLIIKGDTGCGKSTQVPQFILDKYIKQNNTHECNIVVSEPRRISAISLTERVAFERDEKIGDKIGYHVRFDNKTPRTSGSILYCTTGILLQKLRHNSTLKGVSHVIIDEAHERSLQTDMLLMLFKDMLEHNPHVKLIVMSASINTDVFQQYFSTTVIDVPGELHHVKMHFLDDIDFLNENSSNQNTPMKIEIPFNNIVSLIQWIIKDKPPGAILCFLPGWKEIKELYNMLQYKISNLLILPLHSKVSNNDQQKVFRSAPDNITKIILATDIAETGITIRDIKYVIDTAVKREVRWNKQKLLSSLDFSLISQASICQRKGRAGRVKSGESYHLITRKQYNELDLYPRPEILKIPLEEAIIISKTLSDKKALDFFNNMIDPPNISSIISAVNNLKISGFLDKDENFTSLGERVSYISLHPNLSKAAVLSCVLQCFNPVLSIITTFASFNGPTLSLNEISSPSRVLKGNVLEFHETSDHIGILKYFQHMKYSDNNSLSAAMQNADRIEFKKIFDVTQKLFSTYVNELVSSGMVSETSNFKYLNAYSGNNELIRAILFAATNHLIKRNVYGYKKRSFTNKANILMTEANKVVKINNGSVNYNRTTWPSELLTYINKMEFVKRHSCIVSDTSMISPLSVLLFSEADVECEKIQNNVSTEEEQICIRINNIKNLNLTCKPEIADMLLQLRSMLWGIVHFIIKYEGKNGYQDKLQLIQPFRDDLMVLISKILTESSRHIDNTSDANENLRTKH